MARGQEPVWKDGAPGVDVMKFFAIQPTSAFLSAASRSARGMLAQPRTSRSRRTSRPEDVLRMVIRVGGSRSVQVLFVSSAHGRQPKLALRPTAATRSEAVEEQCATAGPSRSFPQNMGRVG